MNQSQTSSNNGRSNRQLGDASSDELIMLDGVKQTIEEIQGYENYFFKLFQVPKDQIEFQIPYISEDCKEFKKKQPVAFRFKSQRELCVNIAKLYDNYHKGRCFDYSMKFAAIMELNCLSSQRNQSISQKSQCSKLSDLQKKINDQTFSIIPIQPHQSDIVQPVDNIFKSPKILQKKQEESKQSLITVNTEEILGNMKDLYMNDFEKFIRGYFYRQSRICCFNNQEDSIVELIHGQKKPNLKQYKKALGKLGLKIGIKDLQNIDYQLIQSKLSYHCQQLYNEHETNESLISKNQLKLVKIKAALEIIKLNRGLLGQAKDNLELAQMNIRPETRSCQNSLDMNQIYKALEEVEKKSNFQKSTVASKKNGGGHPSNDSTYEISQFQ